MDDSEVLSQPLDKRAASGGLPRHRQARYWARPHTAAEEEREPRQPALWSASEAVGPAVWGAYPKGFIRWAARAMGCRLTDIVHLCSGSVREGRCTVDVRLEQRPDVVADARRLPFVDACAAAVMVDPPYTMEYSRDLYRTAYPRPSHLLAEASRIAQPGAPIGFLHFLVPSPPKGAEIERVYGITTGVGYRMRAFTVYRCRERDLFGRGCD